MRERDRARYMEALERLLDKGIVEDKEVTLHVPALDLDLLGINVHTFVSSYETYFNDGGDVQLVEMEEDAEDALPPDGLLPAPEADSPGSD